jgi:hypothetical protein
VNFLLNILENFLFGVFLPKYLFVHSLTVSTEELYECLNDNRLTPHFPDWDSRCNDAHGTGGHHEIDYEEWKVEKRPRLLKLFRPASLCRQLRKWMRGTWPMPASLQTKRHHLNEFHTSTS